MWVITIGNEKGGVGKSTLAMGLASMLGETSKYRVMLVDADAQGSAADWYGRIDWQGREPSFDLAPVGDVDSLLQVRNLSTDYDLMLMDMPGSLWADARDAGGPGHGATTLDRALTNSDFVIVPVLADDLSIGPTMRLLHEHVRPSGVPYAVLINRYSMRRGKERLQDFKKAYEDAGHPVFDHYVRDLAVNQDAPLNNTVPALYPSGGTAGEAKHEFSGLALELMQTLHALAVEKETA